MDLKKFIAALEIGIPAVGQIVTELHPENTAEGVKIAAGVQLFKFLVEGVQAIAAAGEAPAAPAALTTAAAPEAGSPNAA
jgi:hypothetical protein